MLKRAGLLIGLIVLMERLSEVLSGRLAVSGALRNPFLHHFLPQGLVVT